MSSKLGIGGKGESSAPIKKDAAEPVNGEKMSQQVGQEIIRERRNGYQTISTADYYRAERRGLSGFGQQAQDWLEANVEIDAVHGADGAPGVPYQEDR